MKVLIVDDERHVRDAVRLLVDWQALGIERVLEAEDGAGAIEVMEREKPEIVFTDMMMPGMQGTELLGWLKEHAPSTKTVVISGHDDFDFVRKTVQYGGLDYLLKPIDPEQLEDAVARAVESRRQEERSRKASMEINEIKPVYWDKMLSQLLAEPGYIGSIRDNLQREFGVALDQAPCRIAILSLDTMSGSVRRKFASGMDLLYFSLLNICNEFLRRSNRGYAFRHWNSMSEIVLLLWNGLDSSEALLRSINDGIDRTLGARFDIGVGSVRQAPAGLGQSFREAALALERRNLLERGRRIHALQQAGEPAGKEKSLHLADYEEPIRAAVKSGNEKRIRAALGAWFDAVRKLPAIRVEQVELWRHEYDVLRSRWLQDLLAGAEEQAAQPEAFVSGAGVAALPLGDEGSLDFERWEGRWTEEILKLSREAERLWGAAGHVIYEIEKYIRSHYRIELSLQDIADRFFLSREYISRRFKQEFGENLSDYIGRIRIEKAKELLGNPSFRVSQVANMVGFADEKYFSKVFKKLVGTTPNEYRRQAGEGV